MRLIYNMYLSGYSTPQIAGYLYNKGYKTRSGGRFHTKLVGDILKNEVYIGKIVWNRHHYDKMQKTLRGYRYVKNDPSEVIVAKGKHKPIISEDVFYAVQKKLGQNRKGILNRKGSKEYVLSGLLFCAKCGCKFHGILSVASRKKGKPVEKRRYYRCCGRASYYIKCDNSYIRADDVENEVYKILEVIFSSGINKIRFENLMRNTQYLDRNFEEEIEEIKLKLNKNLAKQERLCKLFVDNLIALEVYTKQIFELREEEHELKLKLEKMKLKWISLEKTKEYKRLVSIVCNNLDSIKRELTTEEKKMLLKLIFKFIKVENGKIKEFQLFEPFKTLYEGGGLRWTETKENVSTLLLSDERWYKWREMILRILKAVNDSD